MRTRRVTLGLFLFALGAGATLAMALSSHLTAPTSHLTAPTASILVPLEPDWGGRWETGVPGVKFIPPAVTPPRRVVVGIARDIESPAIAKETIERLELRMTPYELLQNLTVKPGGSTFAIRISYRDPTGETQQRARRIVLTVAAVAGERIRKETPYDYVWRL